MWGVMPVVYSFGRRISHTEWAEEAAGSSVVCTDTLGPFLLSHTAWPTGSGPTKNAHHESTKNRIERYKPDCFLFTPLQHKERFSRSKQADTLLEQKLKIRFLFSKSSPGAPSGKINSHSAERPHDELPGLRQDVLSVFVCPCWQWGCHYLRISVMLSTAQPPAWGLPAANSILLMTAAHRAMDQQ